jgi:hypothetical protein
VRQKILSGLDFVAFQIAHKPGLRIDYDNVNIDIFRYCRRLKAVDCVVKSDFFTSFIPPKSQMKLIELIDVVPFWNIFQ